MPDVRASMLRPMRALHPPPFLQIAPSKDLGRRGRVALLACLIPLLMACAFKGPGGASDVQVGYDVSADDVWDIQPARMRIYPSSRFVREDGKPLLEARIEFFDAAGDSTKAVGELRFELFTAGPAAQTSSGQRLYAWAVPLLTLEQNELFYDSVTRTYLFRLRLDSLSIVREQTRLKVTLTPARGARISTEGLLTTERGVVNLSPRNR